MVEMTRRLVASALLLLLGEDFGWTSLDRYLARYLTAPGDRATAIASSKLLLDHINACVLMTHLFYRVGYLGLQ